MMQYVFILGREQDISCAEIDRFFLQQELSYRVIARQGEIYQIQTEQPLPKNTMDILGGTKQILEYISETATEKRIVSYLDGAQPDGKIIYSLHGGSAPMALRIKKLLKEQGRSVRYILPNNSATIIHNQLVEKHGDLFIINKQLYKTIGVQPIEAFSKRDYDRPGRDSKRGMLPPKLARILINLLAAPNKAVILDPFCGSGTVLMEALSLGHTTLYGTDISPEAIADTKKSLAWFIEEEKLSASTMEDITLQVSDIALLAKKIPPGVIDHIVFEPYMGEGRTGKERHKELIQTIQELEQLFTTTLQVCATLLPKGGRLSCVIPRFKEQENWLTIPFEKIVQRAGLSIIFLQEKTHLLYHRPDQFVGREIWLLKKPE